MKTPFLRRRPKDELNSMVAEALKAVDHKPPYAAAPRSRHIPDDDPKQRVNTGYKKVPKQFIERRKPKPR